MYVVFTSQLTRQHVKLIVIIISIGFKHCQVLELLWAISMVLIAINFSIVYNEETHDRSRQMSLTIKTDNVMLYYRVVKHALEQHIYHII